jgi:hypothetical protein
MTLGLRLGVGFGHDRSIIAASRPSGGHRSLLATVMPGAAATVAAAARSGTDRSEQRPLHRDLGQLADEVAAVLDDPGADLDQLLAQRRQRPLLDLVGQDQRAQEVGEVVGQGVELEAHRIVAEGMAGQPRPA